MSLIHGTGIVGFAWFYFIYLLLIRKIRFYTKIIREKWAYEYKAVAYSMVIASLILSIAGSIYTVEILSAFFLYLGALISILRNSVIDKYFKPIE